MSAVASDTEPEGRGLSPLSDERIQSIIERVRSAGRELGEHDLMKLSSAAYSNLMEETNWQLRQILTQLQNEIELGLREDATRPGLTEARARKVLEGIHRATRVLDAGLDRNEVTKRFIRLTPEPFDLGQAWRLYLDKNGYLQEGQPVRFPTDPAPVEGDRVRLIQAIAQLFDRFYNDRQEGETVVGSLEWSGGQVEGFVGLSNAHLTTDVLIDELSRPLVVADLRFDLPLARAIFERHGGLVYVQEPEPGTVGFAFMVPAIDSGWDREGSM